MRPRVAFRKDSILALKIQTSPECDITVGILDDADFSVCDEKDALDLDWLKRCQEAGAHIIVPSQAKVPESIPVIRVPINVNDCYSFEKVIRRIQKQLPNTKGRVIDWPRVPKYAKIKGLAIDVDGGQGDMYLAFPVLEALRDMGFTLRAYKRAKQCNREIIMLSPDIDGEDDGNGEVYRIRYSADGTLGHDELYIPRQYQYEKNCHVKIKRTWVDMKLNEAIRIEWLRWKRQFNRPVVVVGLTGTIKGKSMAPDRARDLVDLLKKDYEIAVVHTERTLGDSDHVHDMGGLFNTTQMVHFVSIADGAICVDSGIAHTASALRLPLVVMQSICGVGTHIQYHMDYPEGQKGLVKEMSRGLSCQPCWPSYKCGKNTHPRCLEFDHAEVVAELKKVMSAPRPARKGTLVVTAAGGIGDKLAMLPALQQKKAEGYDIAMSKDMDATGQSLFSVSPVFTAPKRDTTFSIHLAPCDPVKDGPELRALPIQDFHARTLGVTVKDYRVQLNLDTQLLRQYQSWVYAHKRPVIGVALNSAFGVQSRTMPEAFQKRLIDALGVKYHVALIHSGKTSGDATNVTDWGGKLSQREMLHLIAALDGMVAVDSGPAHAACVTGTPLVALMGIVRLEKRYAKYGGNAVRGLDFDLDCSPCWEKGSYGCEKPPKCLEFTPDDVLPALQDVCGYVASPKEPYWDWSVVCRYDRPFTEADAKAYMADLTEIHKFKHDLVKSLPKSPVRKMCEIGVRAGNGARDMKMAWPEAYYHGFDAENGLDGGGPQVLTTYARNLLERFWPATSEITAPFDSQLAAELPDGPYDLVHVDGLHTAAGVIHDLGLALKALAPGGMILIDDYTFIPSVKEGVDAWLTANAALVEHSFHETKRGDIVIWRKQ